MVYEIDVKMASYGKAITFLSNQISNTVLSGEMVIMSTYSPAAKKLLRRETLEINRYKMRGEIIIMASKVLSVASK